MTRSRPNLLLVAASDSSGGSGIQADVRACAAFDVHPLTALTAVTAQGAATLRRIHALSGEVVRAQLDALEGLPIAAVKVGVLATRAAVDVLVDWLAVRKVPVVVDPVLAASAGQALIDDAGLSALTRRLLPAATLVTPNLPELCRLIGGTAEGEERISAARRLGARAVLIKGGHADGPVCEDLLVLPDRVEAFRHPRRPHRAVRGTGCALSTAIAAGLATGHELEEAVARGIAHVQRALEKASGLTEDVDAL